MLVLLLLARPCTLAISTPITIVGCVATRGVIVQNSALGVATISTMGISGVVKSEKSKSRQHAIVTSVQFIVSEISSSL